MGLPVRVVSVIVRFVKVCFSKVSVNFTAGKARGRLAAVRWRRCRRRHRHFLRINGRPMYDEFLESSSFVGDYSRDFEVTRL